VPLPGPVTTNSPILITRLRKRSSSIGCVTFFGQSDWHSLGCDIG
jgi:hypothetical protein